MFTTASFLLALIYTIFILFPLPQLFKKYYADPSDQDDLISIGTIGLIKAVSSYKPDKGVRLATYAARCIENAILTPMHTSFQSSRCLLCIEGICLKPLIYQLLIQKDK